MMVRTHKQTHDAGRHYAVAEALMRGFKAGLVGSSSFIQVNGHKARVQVAADVLRRHKDYLASKGGVRPRNPDSKHAAISPEQVSKWRDG